MSRALRLVDGAESAPRTGEVERVFGHWVFMLGKNPKRVALGPVRRKVIARALELYEREVLELAIEGCAASEWHAGENDRGTPFQDVELILRNEANIERFALMGERLRERERAAAARARCASAGAAPDGAVDAQADAQAAQAQRERLRELAARLRRGG